MAEVTNKQPQQPKTTAEAIQGGAATSAEMAQPNGAPPRRAAAAEATQRASQAAGETVQRAGEAIGETLREGGQAATATQGHLVEDLIGHMQETSHNLAETMQGATEAMRTLVTLPGMNGRGLPELQQTMARLVESLVHSNLRTMQEMTRLVGPGAFFAAQQGVARDCLNALMASGTTMLHATRRAADETLHATRRAADETLHPLQEHLEHRRQHWHRQADRGNGHRHGRVSDVMHREFRLASPDDTVQQAARVMRQNDIGALAVGDNEHLVGMVTEHDLAFRLVAEGRDPTKTKVREVMTDAVPYIFEDEGLEQAADTMAQQHVHRLPVMSRDKRMVGIISMADLVADRQRAGGYPANGNPPAEAAPGTAAA